MAAEVGHLELAYDYLNETAFIDLRDLAFNTRDGVHLAALAGSWLVVVAGFGGMRDHGETLGFAPRLPARLTRLSFRLLYRGRRLAVTIEHAQATYELLDGEPLEVVHHGETLALDASAGAQERLIPALRAREPPAQPPGRKPPLGRRPADRR
jgi:alpha,alpha-trehalose phosphorylase